MLSKRLRSLGITETKTYTLVSPTMAEMFRDPKLNLITLPNPLSVDKSVIRQSLLPSLLQTVDYNKARGIEDIKLYEISNTYYNDNKEDLKLGVVLLGKYIDTSWQNNSLVCDFYVMKGIVENILNYLGLENRYSFIKDDKLKKELHPNRSANILVDGKNVGFFGQINPKVRKDKCLVLEISLTKLLEHKVGKLKFEKTSIYPESHFDLAFVMDKMVTCDSVIKTIKRASSKLLKDIKVFDVYMGDKLKENEKSLAFALTLSDNDHTLSGDEIEKVIANIVKDVETKHHAKLRNE